MTQLNAKADPLQPLPETGLTATRQEARVPLPQAPAMSASQRMMHQMTQGIGSALKAAHAKSVEDDAKAEDEHKTLLKGEANTEGDSALFEFGQLVEEGDITAGASADENVAKVNEFVRQYTASMPRTKAQHLQQRVNRGMIAILEGKRAKMVAEVDAGLERDSVASIAGETDAAELQETFDYRKGTLNRTDTENWQGFIRALNVNALEGDKASFDALAEFIPEEFKGEVLLAEAKLDNVMAGGDLERREELAVEDAEDILALRNGMSLGEPSTNADGTVDDENPTPQPKPDTPIMSEEKVRDRLEQRYKDHPDELLARLDAFDRRMNSLRSEQDAQAVKHRQETNRKHSDIAYTMIDKGDPKAALAYIESVIADGASRSGFRVQINQAKDAIRDGVIDNALSVARDPGPGENFVEVDRLHGWAAAKEILIKGIRDGDLDESEAESAIVKIENQLAARNKKILEQVVEDQEEEWRKGIAREGRTAMDQGLKFTLRDKTITLADGKEVTYTDAEQATDITAGAMGDIELKWRQSGDKDWADKAMNEQFIWLARNRQTFELFEKVVRQGGAVTLFDLADNERPEDQGRAIAAAMAGFDIYLRSDAVVGNDAFIKDMLKGDPQTLGFYRLAQFALTHGTTEGDRQAALFAAAKSMTDSDAADRRAGGVYSSATQKAIAARVADEDYFHAFIVGPLWKGTAPKNVDGIREQITQDARMYMKLSYSNIDAAIKQASKDAFNSYTVINGYLTSTANTHFPVDSMADAGAAAMQRFHETIEPGALESQDIDPDSITITPFDENSWVYINGDTGEHISGFGLISNRELTTMVATFVVARRREQAIRAADDAARIKERREPVLTGERIAESLHGAFNFLFPISKEEKEDLQKAWAERNQ